LKAIILILILWLGLVLKLSAQVPKWEYGVQAECSNGYLFFLGGAWPSSYLSGGIILQRDFNPSFSLQTGLSYNRAASYSYNDGRDLLYTGWAGYHESEYLKIPLLAKRYFGKKHLFYLEGGPFLDYLTRYYTRDSFYVGSKYSSSVTSTNYKFSKPFFVGVNIGLGFDIPLSQNILLNIGLRQNVYNFDWATIFCIGVRYRK